MRNVFIAVGGSGTKVAEALVRLLAIGFPTRRDGDLLTSAGDSLQIWRLDPDRVSGAAVSLDACLKDYKELQDLLNDGPQDNTVAKSGWAMDIDTQVRHLDPLELPRAEEGDNSVRTLGGILDSQYSGVQRSLPFLAPFYEEKDLRVEIDRGFYQKPFIGAAVMSVFAESLHDENSPGGKACALTSFHNTKTNFFLCGSLHGGTGACGVPVLGEYLSTLKKKKENQNWDWSVGACLLTPYCVPPQPPFGQIRDRVPSADEINDLVKAHGDKPAFSGLAPEEKSKLVNQILLGFYAEPEAMEARARQGLAYYRDHAADYFDELYLVGKPEPDKLKVWSNGGKSQSNPLNSAEVVAALAALNFFSRAGTGNKESYVIGASRPELNSDKMHLRDLPRYEVETSNIDPEAVFLATAAMRHLTIHQIPWDIPGKSFPDDISKLKKIYETNEGRKVDDYARFAGASVLLTKFLMSSIHPDHTIGWSGEDAGRIWPYLSPAESDVKEISAKTAKKLMRKEAKGELELGNSSIRVSTFEFGEWCPEPAEFSRGGYMRLVWSQLMARAQKRIRAIAAR
jgi:hypothetical protein